MDGYEFEGRFLSGRGIVVGEEGGEAGITINSIMVIKR